MCGDDKDNDHRQISLFQINPQIQYPVFVSTLSAGVGVVFITLWTKCDSINVCSLTYAVTVTRGTLTGNLKFYFSADDKIIECLTLFSGQTSNSIISTTCEFFKKHKQLNVAVFSDAVQTTGSQGSITVASLAGTGYASCGKSCNKDKDRDRDRDRNSGRLSLAPPFR